MFDKKKCRLGILLAGGILFSLSGCMGIKVHDKDSGAEKSGYSSEETNREEEKIQIVTTIFPEYDWVMQVLGDRAKDAEVTMLCAAGVDLHSFQPSVDDIIRISDCDLFVYVGGESDTWVEDSLAEARNQEMVTVNLLESLGEAAREEETVEGMQEKFSFGEEEEEEYDEHVWLSLRNAEDLVEQIKEALCTIDPEHAAEYRENTEAYQQRLRAQDEQFQETVARGEGNTLLFADRFPFRYLTEDYGLEYYAAFSGCSAETEASFKTITFLAQKIDELNLPVVLTMEKTDPRIAQTVIANTEQKNQKIMTMNSMQAVTDQEISKGISYLGMMEENRQVLEEALKGAK